MREGWLEQRNGESAAIKRWRSLPDPKFDAFADEQEVEEVVPFGPIGGRMEQLGRALDDLALLQWRENKVGLALAAVFIVSCLVAVAR
jgi:hypothetical protein